MVEKLGLKQFLEKVEAQVKTFSPEKLRQIILRWAQETPPASRRSFLDNLMLLEKSINVQEPDDSLLDDIQELFERAESGDLCEGFGWDPESREERDFGDESWAEEVDDFFVRAGESLNNGHYELARKAFEGIFDILSLGEEAEHLPGPEDSEELLSTDMVEARAQYLRSIYLASPEKDRPANLWDAIERFQYGIDDKLNLRAMQSAGREDLPEFSEFLQQWLNFLDSKKGPAKQYLLREATLLAGGTSALAELAHSQGNKHPRMYIDYLNVLEKNGDLHAVATAAKEALDAVPVKYMLRAEIGEKLAQAGENLKDLGMQLAGWHEAFQSDPCLAYLVPLLEVATPMGRRAEEIESATARIRQLLEQEKTQSYPFHQEDDEREQASATETLLAETYLLAGQFRQALEVCSGEKPLGWSSGNPKGEVVPFLLTILGRGIANGRSPNVDQVWKNAVSDADVEILCEGDSTLRFERALEQIIQSTTLTKEEAQEYIDWCVTEVGQRVAAIVGEQHRGSYAKAATLLIAMAEVLVRQGLFSRAIAFVNKYRQKYHRHSSFQRDLQAAIERSGLAEINQ